MTEIGKIGPRHLDRQAVVYVRQSTASQVEHHRESTARQYALAERAHCLGWPAARVVVIDEDLGLSGASAGNRSGFARMTAEVALGHVGIVLGLEVSRLARNNGDWYRLLDLCGMTDTLIGDADGVYHPAGFNDRLVLGLKGTMSEAELHILRARLDGGIRNKAARGELRRGLPLGFVWGEAPGEVRFHPDAAVSGAIRAVFDRFRELGSARRVWLWFCSEGLPFPTRAEPAGEIRWGTPTYTAINRILVNPVYAGAYAYGRVTSAASTSKVVSASASGACPRTNGPCSCPIITPAMSIGRRSRPIARASPATPGRGRTKAVACSEKVPPCFRASPPAVTVAADCAPIIAAHERHRATIALASTSSMAVASIA